VDVEQLIEQVEHLQKILIDRIHYENRPDRDYERYSKLRRSLIQSARVRSALPEFVLECRTLDHAHRRINNEAPRPEFSAREYVWESFKDLFDLLEQELIAPSDFEITETLESLDSNQIHGAWKKALDRRSSDPEGAVTMARTLLESTCKHLLEEMEKSYNRKDDLPTLYSNVAEELNLSPSQHTEEIFSRILGSAQQVVEGLGAVRNRHSDAHGDSSVTGRPSERHAELAVNLAGSTASFLVKTYRANTEAVET
jgi:hypothetical protein